MKKLKRPLFGSHLSIAGGYYKAVDRAAELGFDTVQLFTKNNNRWQGTKITDAMAQQFRDSLNRHGIVSPLSHASYLINMASPDDQLWQRSIDAMIDELHRANLLSIENVVVHPGAFRDSDLDSGITRIIDAISIVLDRTEDLSTSILLETTAGQGTCIGHRFEHLAEIMRRVDHQDRLAVCLDTCHMFAAGYDMASKSSYNKTMKQLDETVGIAAVRAVHLNDSLRPAGSRVDRHAHIGRGEMGIEPFRNLLGDRRFHGIPMYLETPKETEGEGDEAVEMDTVNLKVLQGLLRE